jgi:hypothetical protein
VIVSDAIFDVIYKGIAVAPKKPRNAFTEQDSVRAVGFQRLLAPARPDTKNTRAVIRVI